MGSPEWKLMVDLDGTNAQGRRRAHKHGNSLGASRSCPDLTANGFQIDYGTPLEADNQAQRAWELLKSPDHLSIHYGGPESATISGEERDSRDRTKGGWGAKYSWPRGQTHCDHLSCSDKLVSAREEASKPRSGGFLPSGTSSPSTTDDYRQAWPSGTDPGTRMPRRDELVDIGKESSVYSNEIWDGAWSDLPGGSDASDVRILLVSGCLLSMSVLCLGHLLPSIYPILVAKEWPPRDNWIKLSSSQEVAAVPSHPSDLVSPSMLLSCLFFSAAVFSSLFCVRRRNSQGLLVMGSLALHPFIGLHYNVRASGCVLILNYLILGGLALAMIETGQLSWLMDLESPTRRGRERRRPTRKTLVMQHYLISRHGLGHILCGLVITLTLWASSNVHGNAANSQGRLLRLQRPSFAEQISIHNALPTNRSIHPASARSGHFLETVLSTPSFKTTHPFWSTFVSLGCGWNTLLGCCLIASGCATVLSILGAICSRSIESHSEAHRQFTRGKKKKWGKESVGNLSFYPFLQSVLNTFTKGVCGNPLWNMIRHLGLIQGFFYLNFIKPTILGSLGQYHLGPILMVYGTSQTLVLWMLGHLAESSIPWRLPLMGVNTLFHIGSMGLTVSLRFQSGSNDFLKFYALSFVWGFVSSSWDFITLTHIHKLYFQYSSKEEEQGRSASVSKLITNKFFGLTVISLYDVYSNSIPDFKIRNEVIMIYLVGLLMAVISYICTEIKQEETQHSVVKYAKTSDDIKP